MECKKDIGGKFKSRSSSKFNSAKVKYYINCLFIPNPQGHPNSMTTVVQSAVQTVYLECTADCGPPADSRHPQQCYHLTCPGRTLVGQDPDSTTFRDMRIMPFLCLCSMPDGQPYYAPRNCLLCSIIRKDDCMHRNFKMLLAFVVL